MIAQFNSLCVTCNEWIRPGMDISISVDGTSHRECGGEPPARRPPCAECWQIPSVVGLCGCEK